MARYFSRTGIELFQALRRQVFARARSEGALDRSAVVPHRSRGKVARVALVGSRYEARRDASNGFTLVELLIVIVVIAILAAITVVAYNGVTQRAHGAAAQSLLSQAGTKLATQNVETGSYPSDLTDTGIKGDSGTQLSYVSSGQGYCLAATPQDGSSYFITDSNTSPREGDCDSQGCPSGFIAVPGNATFGTSDFCVMKYEAKNDGSDHPVSTASGTPWVSISQTSAITASQSAVDQSGATVSGAHLITDPEWMTIAANVLSVPSNWSGGAVGSGYIYNGHTNNNPANALAASTDDTDGLNGITGGTGSTSGSNNRRTLTLTNGAVIWDFAGNVWEWDQGTIQGNQPGSTADTGYIWHDWNATLGTSLASSNLPASSLPGTISAQAASWTRTQGVGELYSNGADAAFRGFIRGGGWNDGSIGGVLALSLHNAPSNTYTYIGFRVAR